MLEVTLAAVLEEETEKCDGEEVINGLTAEED